MKRSYLLPSYHNIWKRLLSDTKNKIKVRIVVMTKMFIQTYGRWVEFGQQPPSSKYTSRHTKDAIYIANVMKRYLAKVGPKNVVQICTDNASVIVKPFVLYKRIGRTYTSKDAWLMH
jgi:hypothetical protein